MRRLKATDRITRLRARSKHIMNYARHTQRTAVRAVPRRYRAELAMARALVASLSYVGMAFWANRNEKRVFPTDWLRPDGQCNADVLLGLGGGVPVSRMSMNTKTEFRIRSPVSLSRGPPRRKPRTGSGVGSDSMHEVLPVLAIRVSAGNQRIPSWSRTAP
jgi:hypothetical protein